MKEVTLRVPEPGDLIYSQLYDRPLRIVEVMDGSMNVVNAFTHSKDPKPFNLGLIDVGTVSVLSEDWEVIDS